MAQKRFGPTLDAGTVIIEQDAEKSIEPSALGSTAYVGVLERGAVGELITAVSKKSLLKKTGGYIPDSLLPDACKDFWDEGNGAGTLFLYRVTDGNEVKSQLTLWDRSSAKNKVVKIEAKNGGWWGGRKDTVVCDVDDVTDIGYGSDETKIKLPDALVVKKNKWKNGTVIIHGQSGDVTYNILSNTAGDGVSGAVLTLAADSTADTDYGTSTDLEIVLNTLSVDAWGQDKKLAVQISDGQVYPSSEWGLKLFLHGDLVAEWPNLSSDPNSDKYFVDIINEDDSNEYITVTDLWAGAVTASTRPSNFYCTIASTAISATSIDLSTCLVVVDTSEAGANTIGTFTFGANVIPDTYELTYAIGTTDWGVVSTGQQTDHAFPRASDATPYAADNAYSFGFTVTESGPSDGEKFTVYVIPLYLDEAIGGKIFFPDESFAPAVGWSLSDNTRTGATIVSGDMTNGGTISGNINVMLSYPQELAQGHEGIWDIGTSDFQPAFDTNTSPFIDLDDQGYGLVKFATPGIQELMSAANALTVQQAGIAFAEARNHQFRVEFPSNYTDESTAKSWVNDTLGRSDHIKICFPSYAKVADPIRTGVLKTVSLSGMIMGEEARIAKNYDGFHKVAAGIDAKLSKIRELPTLERKLNGEILNPVGIQRVIIKKGNFVLWGARIPYVDPSFVFCQHREYLSHIEHTLQESYDWLIYAINDEEERPKALAAAQSLFLPEWRKRAIRGNTLQEAAAIKVDDENNTAATMAAGEMHMEIKLQIADTVEQFIITIGKQGIFETTAA